MLHETEIKEIREHLENARNPIFFYDNDPDGLCSFLLLQKYLGKGRGVAIKSFPGLDKTNFHKVEEFNADYIFVLDKPVIDKEFIELAEKKSIPLVHIDHHNVEKTPIKFYYNTFYSSGLIEPVSYICYKVTRKKEDMWLALIGCITDSFIPDFISEFKEKYPEMIDIDYKDARDILYRTRFGKVAMIVSFAMKDTTSNLISMIRFLIKAQGPNDILEETAATKTFLSRFKYINEKYQRLILNAEKAIKGKIVFFTYAGDLSISQYTANELFYKHPDKAIIVAFTSGNKANVSLRWYKDIRAATINAIVGIEGATGGGHEHSAGAKIPVDKLKEFELNLVEEIKRIDKSN